jgi:energy-coupling factor transport system permease protein
MNVTRIVYRPRASPLHAARAPIAAAYGAALAAGALIVEHPLLLGALLVAVVGAAVGAGVARELALVARRTTLPILALTVIVNVIVSRGGLTVFARLGDWGVLGQVNLTVEAVVYGLVVGLRLLVVTLACTLIVCAVDPDRLMFAFRRVAPHSALTAALATRMIPVLGQDAQRLADAQRCRPDGGAGGMRGRMAILRATVGGALERSLDVAAVLEMRGYGSAGRSHAAHEPLSRHDLAFAASAAAIVLLSALALVLDVAAFATYPLVHASLTPAGMGCAVALVAVALAPFADRRGIEP